MIINFIICIFFYISLPFIFSQNKIMNFENNIKLVEEYKGLAEKYCFFKIEKNKDEEINIQLKSFLIYNIVSCIKLPITGLIISCYYKNIVFINIFSFVNVIYLRKIHKNFYTISQIKKKYADMLQDYGQIVCDYLDSFTFVDYAINCHYVIYPTYDDVKKFVTQLGFTRDYEKNQQQVIPFLYTVMKQLYKYERKRLQNIYSAMFTLENFPMNTLEKKISFYKETLINWDITHTKLTEEEKKLCMSDIEESSKREITEYINKAIKFRQNIIQKLSSYAEKHCLGDAFDLYSKYSLHIFEVYSTYGFFIDKETTMNEIEDNFLKNLNLPLHEIFQQKQKSESLPVILHAPFFIIHFWPNIIDWRNPVNNISNPIFCQPLTVQLQKLNITSDFLKNIDIPEGKKGMMYKKILYNMVCAKDTLCSNSVIYFKDCTSLFINNFLSILKNEPLQKDEIITLLKIFLYGYIIKNNVGKERSINEYAFQTCEPYIDKTEKELEEIKILIKNILPGFEHIYFYCKENKSVVFHKGIFALLYLLDQLKRSGIEESFAPVIIKFIDKKYQLSFHDSAVFLDKLIFSIKKNACVVIELDRLTKYFEYPIDKKLFLCDLPLKIGENK